MRRLLNQVPKRLFAKKKRIEFPKLDIGEIPEELKYDRNAS